MYLLRIAFKIASIALYLLTALSAYGGFIPPRVWAAPAVLVLAFPYLLILTAAVAVCWLIAGRIFTGIAGGVTVAVCWPVAVAACPVKFGSEPVEPGFTLMTYNVYDLSDYQHPSGKTASRTLSYIISQHPDIVCLQELSHLPRGSAALRAQSDSLRRIYPYIIGGKPTLGTYSPFMLMSRYPAREQPLPEWIWTDCALYRITLPGMPLYILNVHLTSYRLTDSERRVVSGMRSPGGARQSMTMEKSVYAKLSDAFRNRQHLAGLVRNIIDSVPGPMIVCGDFNDVPGSYAYRSVAGRDLEDAVAKTSFGPMITYNAHGFLFHIDQILYRGPLTPHRIDKGTLRSSDHYPLTATFSYTTDKPNQ